MSKYLTQWVKAIMSAIEIQAKEKIISPGKAILILLAHYQKEELAAPRSNTPTEAAQIITRLRTLYLLGADNERFFSELKFYFKHDCLRDYHISYDANVINEDVVRRYFETHLAYETLINTIHRVEKDYLSELIYKIIPRLDKEHFKIFLLIESGKKSEFENIFHKEYADCIKKIEERTLLGNLPDEQREKIILLLKVSALCILSADQNGEKLPLNLYGMGFYSDKHRGKFDLEEQPTTENMFLGIIKSTAALAPDDIVYAPQEERGYTKASDKSGFDSTALWTQYSFSKLVHPFSNSISGTFLSFLKHLALFKNDNTIQTSKEEIENISKMLISLLQLCTGGHSLFEYTYPIQLQAVQDEFADIEGFSDLTLEEMFLESNEPAFSLALERAMEYMSKIPVSQETVLESHDLVITEANYAKIVQRKTRLDYYLSSLNDIIKDLEELLQKNKARVDSEYLAFWRRGSELHDTIEQMTKSIIAQLKVEHIKEAIIIADTLIDYVVEKDGKKNPFGLRPQSYQLALDIRQKIIDFKCAQIDFGKTQSHPSPQLSLS